MERRFWFCAVALCATALTAACSKEPSATKSVDTTIEGSVTQASANVDVAIPATEPVADAPAETFGLASHPSYAQLDFDTYRTEAYAGPTVLPDFSGPQRDYATYRTRLTETAQSGIGFAGHYALSQIGCGSQCSFVNIIDLSNGQIFDFPLGGEENLELELSYRPDSSLLLARYLTYAPDGGEPSCHYKSYAWTGRSFDELTSAIAPGPCVA
jgi:hypothetical protein